MFSKLNERVVLCWMLINTDWPTHQSINRPHQSTVVDSQLIPVHAFYVHFRFVPLLFFAKTSSWHNPTFFPLHFIQGNDSRHYRAAAAHAPATRHAQQQPAPCSDTPVLRHGLGGRRRKWPRWDGQSGRFGGNGILVESSVGRTTAARTKSPGRHSTRLQQQLLLGPAKAGCHGALSAAKFPDPWDGRTTAADAEWIDFVAGTGIFAAAEDRELPQSAAGPSTKCPGKRLFSAERSPISRWNRARSSHVFTAGRRECRSVETGECRAEKIGESFRVLVL